MSMTSFPVLALSILGIITTAILLASYYIFVIKCCLNTNRYDMDRLLRARNHRHRGTHNQSLTIYPTNPIEPQGLDESTIKSIPTFTYKKLVNSDTSKFDRNMSRHECAVCLNEFQEGEKVRFLPTCSHVFHVDCIDTWLRTNANCPLCRSPVENPNYLIIPVDQLGNHVDQENNHDDIIINMEEEDEEALRRNNGGKMKSRKLISKDDECILELRKLEKQFSVRPIKRSFSMDSSSRRRVYEEVEKVLQRNPHFWETRFPESSGKDILPVLDCIGVENASSA